MDVHRVRQPEVVHRAGDRLDHLPRRDPGALVVERRHVAVAALPHLDAAGIDELDAVAARRLQVPGDRLAHARRLGADELEERQVVAHQHEEGGVDHRRVADLGQRVAGSERRRGGLDDGRVAEQRVAVAGGERRGHGPAGAGPHDRGALDDVGAVLLGRELARGVDRRPGDVGVDVDPARHDDHPVGVDRAGVGGHVVDDLAVLHADVALLAGDAVGGVVDAAAGDPQHQRRSSMAASTSSTLGRSLWRGARSGIGTPSMRWAVPATSMPSTAVAKATREPTVTVATSAATTSSASNSPRSASRGKPRAKSTGPANPGLPGEHVLGAAGVAGAQAERDRVAVAGEVAYE